MNPGHRMPSSIIYIINDWIFEFHRADAVARYHLCRNNAALRTCMSHICSDIRNNPPTYQVDILTQQRTYMRLRFYLYDCNPNEIQSLLPVSELHHGQAIVSIRRRSIASRALSTYSHIVEIIHDSQDDF